MFGIFKRTLNNLFLTICFDDGRVLISKSVGAALKKNLKAKKRRTVLNIGSLAAVVASDMRKKKIRTLSVFFVERSFIRHSPKKIMFTILEPFKRYQIRIGSFVAFTRKAHNGVRKRKPRRR